MEKKERIESIIRNLDNTISKMTNKERWQSQSTAFETPSASKGRLVSIRLRLRRQLNAL